MKTLFFILAMQFSNLAFSCSMFLEANIDWGKKIKNFEKEAIAYALNNSDQILVVRVIKHLEVERAPLEALENVIVDGPNPRKGEISTRTVVEVLDTIRGNSKIGQELIVDVYEPDKFGRGECGDPDPSYVWRVNDLDRTFKYLLYLKGSKVLRQNMFIEWHERLSAEEEFEKIK